MNKDELTEKLKEDYALLKKQLTEERIPRIIERFSTMEPFKTIDDIPEIPVVDKEIYDSVIIPNLIRCGAIPKKDLIVGKTYLGDTRNASEATWNGEEFEYRRYKFGFWYDDSVNHFEDDDGHALFVPLFVKEEKTK